MRLHGNDCTSSTNSLILGPRGSGGNPIRQGQPLITTLWSWRYFATAELHVGGKGKYLSMGQLHISSTCRSSISWYFSEELHFSSFGISDNITSSKEALCNSSKLIKCSFLSAGNSENDGDLCIPCSYQDRDSAGK